MIPVVGVMGGHDAPPEVLATAEALGAAIAARGWRLLTGGRREGIMQAASQGAKSAGGFVIAIHPDANPATAADADVLIRTGIGFARNSINVLSSDVVVCLPGGPGTLSEAAYAATYGKPLVFFGFEADLPAIRVHDVVSCIEAIAAQLGPRA